MNFRSTYKSLALACLVALPVAAFAQQKKTAPAKKAPAKPANTAQAVPAKLDRTQKPKAGPAPRIQLAAPEMFTLANGLKVYVVPNKKLPRIAYNLVLDYDPILEKEYAGYVTLAGDLIGRGTKTRSKEQLDEEVEFLGASLTTSPSGVYVGGLSRNSEKLMELFADVILNPAMKQEELDVLKKQTKSSIVAAKSNPSAIAGNVTRHLLFGDNHPYGDVPTEETVDRVDAAKCRQFYETYYRPEVGYLAIVGDIDLPKAKAMVEKHLSSWQRGNVPKGAPPMPKMPTSNVVAIVDRPASVQSVITVAHVADLKPNDPNVIKARMMNDVLGGGSAARLFMNLREKHGWTYGSYSNLQQDKYAGRFSATANVRNAVTDSSVAELLNEMSRIGDEEVTTEELTLSRNALSGNFVIGLEQPQTVANYAINIARYNLPPDFYQTYLQKVSGVTAADVSTAAKSYVNSKGAYIIVVGKAEEIAPKLARFGKIEYFDEFGRPAKRNELKAVPAGVTVQTVTDKFLESIGTRKNVEKVKDVSLTYTADLQGNTATMTQQIKLPNKLKAEMRVGPQLVNSQVSDGKAVQAGGMQGVRKLEGADLSYKLATQNMFWELDPASRSLTAKVLGIETVNKEEAYKVEVMGGGKSWTEYYSVANGQKVRTIRTNPFAKADANVQTLDYSNYQDAGKSGIKVPGTILLTGGPIPIEQKLQKAEVNTGLKDDMFEVK